MAGQEEADGFEFAPQPCCSEGGQFFSQRYDLLFEVCSGFKRMAMRSTTVLL